MVRPPRHPCRHAESAPITVRLSTEQLSALDEYAAAEHGGNRLKAVQALVDRAHELDDYDALDLDDLRWLLESRAKGGSVAAIRELQRRHDVAAGRAEVDRLNAMMRA